MVVAEAFPVGMWKVVWGGEDNLDIGWNGSVYIYGREKGEEGKFL